MCWPGASVLCYSIEFTKFNFDENVESASVVNNRPTGSDAGIYLS